MRTWRAVVLVAFVLGTGFLFYRWWQAASSRVKHPAGGAGDPDESAQPAAAEPGGGATPGSGGAASAGAGRSGPPLDRAKADRMREAIRALLADAGPLALGSAPLASSSARPAGSFRTMPEIPDPDGGGTKIDPDYIRQRVRDDLIPLAKDCYVTELEKNPKLSGRLQVYFKVIGDKKVGGVVDEVKLLDGTTLDDPYVQTCVKESMMAVSFDAPPGDGELTVIYPLVFSPDEPDGGDGG